MGGNLIFLISQPRSGSTLLQKMLGAHPAVHTVAEPWVALLPLFGLRESGIATDYSARLGRMALRGFLQGLPEGEAAYWEGARRMLSYLYERHLAEAGRELFLDKTPRYYFIVNELRLVFPEARFIYLLRNPLAVLVSILDTFVRSENPMAVRANRHDLVRAPRLMADAIASASGRSSIVRYEALVNEPEPELRRICAEIQLPYSDGMVEYGATEAGRKRLALGDPATVYRERRPVKDRTDRWKDILLDRPVWRAWAGVYLRSLGPETVERLGYNYSEMAAEFPDQPEYAGQWAQATQPNAAF